MFAGENGEKVAAIGDETGMMVEDRGGDIGRWGGGGVTESALGVAHPDEGGDRAGDESTGEYWPLY